jgi:ABC-type Zn uptake system ZnuABC Zn-binding protein ZnuA
MTSHSRVQAPTRRRLAAAVALVAPALLLAACSSGGGAATSSGAAPTTSGGAKLIVATTVSPITSIAAAVAGGLATVEGIVPEGTNSHTFEPEPQVAELLSTADIVFVNGLKLEDPTIELAQANLKEGAQIVEIGTTVLPESDYLYDFSFPEEEGKPNPHLWTDPSYAIKYAGVIRDALSARDPGNASAYTANFDRLVAQINAVDAALRADQESLPADKRKLVTYHDAYAYWAKNYGWTVVGAIQPDSFDDPSPAEVIELIKQIRAEGVTTIFGSEVFPSPVLEEIARETGVRYEDSLRDDDLPGAPGEPGHSWAGLMTYNYTTMIRGLGGTTPALDALVIDSSLDDQATYPQ